MAKAATVADLLKKKKPLTKTFQIVLDGELADEWVTVKADYDFAKRQVSTFDNPITQDNLKDAKKAYDELRPKVEEATVEVVLQAIGRPAYEALLDAHPATEEQQDEATAKNPNAQVLFNYKTFPRALLACSLVSPKMTEAEVDELLESPSYNAAELTNLINAATEVNQTSKVVDLGKG